MFELHLKADGPMEQWLMSKYDELKAILADTKNLSAEAVQIREAFNEFKASIDALKTANADLIATVEQLKTQNAETGNVTDAQFDELIVLAKAKNEAIDGLYTPDFVGTEPTPPVDPVVPSE